MGKTITTIIPTLHRPEGLTEAVRSVLNQTRIPDELIIVDQSRDDKSLQEIKKIFSGYSGKPELIYVYDTSVKGLVEAKVRGVREGSSDIISFIEDDVILTPDYFKVMEEGFRQKENMMGCSGVLVHVPVYTKFYKQMFHLFHRGLFYDARIDVHERGDDHGKEGDKIILKQSRYLSGGISAYKKEVFEEVKFDTVNDFFMYEDIEFSTRAAQYYGDDKFFINMAMKLDHRMSPINRLRLETRWKRKLYELICFYKKNREWPYALPSLLWLIVGFCIEAVFSTLKLKHFGPLKGTIYGIYTGINTRIRSQT